MSNERDEYGRVMLGIPQGGSEPLLTNERGRLVSLDPRWAGTGDNRHGQALSFLCPIHRTHRLVVPFANPVDGGEPMPGYAFYWQRQGETFESMTLGPSVDASSHTEKEDMVQTQCWHGFIRGGYVE